MFSLFKIVKRIQAVIPKSYKNKTVRFFIFSLILLVLDIFSIFLLIPLIISLLDQDSDFAYLPIKFLKEDKTILITIVVSFFLIKNYIAIHINKYQAKIAYQLSSEYSLSLSKYYILGNYIAFKKQKKSSIIKEIIFVANDFVGNVLLSVNIIFSEFALLFFICLIGLYYYFTITLIAVVILGLIVYLSRYYNRKTIDRINKTKSDDYDKNISNLNNLLNGFMSIKSSDLLNHFLDSFNNSNKKLNHNYSILHSKRINSSKQTEILMVIILCSVFIFINFFSLKGISAVMLLSVFGALFFKAIPSINKLNISLTNLNSHLYALDIIEKKITSISKIASDTALLKFDFYIKLEDISFSYKKNKPLFKNLNIIINKGEFIAITGVSGIGKTTLLNIISKLIDSNSGSIYVDNTKVTNTNKYNYFNLITYLTQSPFIYEGTILDNLVLSNKKVDEDEINKMLKALDLLEIINQLPKKLYTYIGSDGSNLSGGQLQRLCIARALLFKPEILILDEATNNLDKNTERKVLHFLKYFIKENNTTIISVSHHLENEQNIFNTIIDLDQYYEV